MAEDTEAGLTARQSRRDDVEAWLTLFIAVAGEGRWIGAEVPIDREWRPTGGDRASAAL
jgi:hypothetical protein